MLHNMYSKIYFIIIITYSHQYIGIYTLLQFTLNVTILCNILYVLYYGCYK